MHHGRHYDGTRGARCCTRSEGLAPKLKKKGFDEVYEIASGHKFKSRAAPLAATPVAHVAVDHTILGSMVLGRFHLGFCLIPDYFHGHFCLGAGVFDPQHGDCQQPSVTSVYFELA
jgi:hypothetical protein